MCRVARYGSVQSTWCVRIVAMYTVRSCVRYRYVDNECDCAISFPRLILSNPLSSPYIHINIYDDSSAPSVRASGARGVLKRVAACIAVVVFALRCEDDSTSCVTRNLHNMRKRICVTRVLLCCIVLQRAAVCCSVCCSPLHLRKTR